MDPVDDIDEDDREFPPQYARKLVHTILGDEDEASKAALLASTYARKQLIRRNWPGGSSDWYARADGTWPTDEDLIEPRFAACLQIGYFNELMPISAAAAIDRVIAAARCLEGRVVEDQRIELINYLRHAKKRDQSDAFAVCYRLSQRTAAMLEVNQIYYNWFVLGRELGLCMIRRIIGALSSETRGLVSLSEGELSWDQWLTGKVNWDELNPSRGCWHWDGFPANLQWIEIQSLVDVLADGWQLFPLPSTKRIEIFSSYHPPADLLDLFEGEEVANLATYLTAKRPMTEGIPTAKGEATPPVPSGGNAPTSSMEVLQIVTDMINRPKPDFSDIGGLVESWLHNWSDDQVRGLLELERLSVPAKRLRKLWKEWDSPDKSPPAMRKKCGGNNQRIRFILRLLERLGEYDGFGINKAARKPRIALE